MNTTPNQAKLGALTRRLIAVPAFALVVSLAFTGAASAQTTLPFQASVNNISTHGGGDPGLSCLTQFSTWFYCGTATIAGHGLAVWWFDSPGPLMGTPVGSDCAEYRGTSNFELVNDPQQSTLVLNEDVTLCHPGNSGNTPNFWGNTYGHPNRLGDPSTGWTVCDASYVATPDPSTGCGEPIPGSNPLQIRVSTGVFSALTGGSGTDDSFQTNGAILTAAWSGTLTF
jgi:hypothetical protein